MSTLDKYRDFGIQVALRGHGGELARMQWAYELACNRFIRDCRTQSGCDGATVSTNGIWSRPMQISRRYSYPNWRNRFAVPRVHPWKKRLPGWMPHGT